MSLTENDIKKVAHLARLSLSEPEIPAHTKSISSILQFVEQMNKVDTTGIAPMSHPQDVFQPVREDEITETNQRELMQSIAPHVEAGLYLVPKVIE